MNSFLRVSS